MIKAIRTIKFLKFISYGADTLIRVKKLLIKVSICFPIVFKMVLTQLFIFYIYAIIGMICFNTQTRKYREGSPYIENDYTSFNDFGSSLLSLFQVCTESQWTIFIYDYGYKYDFVSASIFFCTFHLFTVLFMMSLL